MTIVTMDRFSDKYSGQQPLCALFLHDLQMCTRLMVMVIENLVCVENPVSAEYAEAG